MADKIYRDITEGRTRNTPISVLGAENRPYQSYEEMIAHAEVLIPRLDDDVNGLEDELKGIALAEKEEEVKKEKANANA